MPNENLQLEVNLWNENTIVHAILQCQCNANATRGAYCDTLILSQFHVLIANVN
jgi:hypothetical protein